MFYVEGINYYYWVIWNVTTTTIAADDYYCCQNNPPSFHIRCRLRCHRRHHQDRHHHHLNFWIRFCSSVVDYKFAFASVIFRTDRTRIVKVQWSGRRVSDSDSDCNVMVWYVMVCLLSNSYAFSNLSGVCCRGVVHFNISLFYWFLQHFLFSFCLLFHSLAGAIRILLCVSSRSDLRHGTSWRMAQPACSWDFVCGRLSSWVHPLYTIGIIVFLLYLFFHSWWWLECTCQLLWRWKKVLHHVFKKTIMVFFFNTKDFLKWILACSSIQTAKPHSLSYYKMFIH